jgi:hypothetical protein
MPGVTVVRQGAWIKLDETGIDRGASASTLMGGDLQSCATAAKVTNLVQIEKADPIVEEKII